LKTIAKVRIIKEKLSVYKPNIRECCKNGLSFWFQIHTWLVFLEDMEAAFSLFLHKNCNLMIRLLVFDWGDTIMRDFNMPGPMSQWPVVEWIEGAKEALSHLHDRYCCAIATSADHSDVSEMKAALARVGADTYFDKFYSQKELGYRKPDVRFFLEVIRLSGYQANESVMIGNLYDKDIVGARKAGMKTVLLCDKSDVSSCPDADFLIRSMHELCELF